MAIEKCDKVVINPLFGSGLQYKHRVSRFGLLSYTVLRNSLLIGLTTLILTSPLQVDAYSVNSYWGYGKPDITKIRLAAACMASKPG